MVTAILGLATAVLFGGADFLGGLAASRVSAIRATVMSAIAGLVVVAAAALVVPILQGTWSSGVFFWGTLTGIVAACTVGLLYAGLAVGPMSILAPLGAVVGAIVPAIYGLLRGERLGALGYAGIVAALIAVVLVGLVPHRDARRARPVGLILATLAGLSMGMGIIVLDNTPADSGILPLIVGRTTSVLVLCIAIGVVATRAAKQGRTDARGWRRAARLSFAGGALGASADVFMLTGVRVGDVAIIGVLVALASAVTVVLAAIVLRERLAPPQVIGLLFAVAAAVLLAAG